MTTNKAQSQSIQICELNLENSCFSRGQLYVTYSRVVNYSFFAENGKTKNVVPELA